MKMRDIKQGLMNSLHRMREVRRPGMSLSGAQVLLGFKPGAWSDRLPGRRPLGLIFSWIFISLNLLLISSASVESLYGANKNAGTAGAQFLKIGAGPRPTALGDSFVAVSEDVNAVYFNPAGIATSSRPEFTAMHTQWIADTSYDFGAFSYPTNHGAFAISASTLKVEDLQRRGTDETRNGSFEAMDSAYALTYGHHFAPLLSLGVTGRMIRQSIDTTSANTWAADVGVMKRLRSRPVSLGLAVRHLGGSIKFRNESDPLPTTVDGGFAATFFREKLMVTADGRWFRDNDPGFGAGVEYRRSLGEKNRLALRGGYNSQATASDGAGLTMGAGLSFGRAEFSFAWVPFADLGNTYRFGLHIRF
ncbi:MAG: hypothetical protein KCHDKBKB_00092 [Elusimicrobia bacterium]|nr:hypothetical protein [Elusimicrobiota bacterium]